MKHIANRGISNETIGYTYSDQLDGYAKET